MAGERTPSQHGSGSLSDDDAISLREHIQRQLDVIRETAQTLFKAERSHTDDSITSTSVYLERIVADLALRFDQRHDISTSVEQDRDFEKDKRYEQRFQAQEQAIAIALSRVDLEFHERIKSVREETQAALDSADKAIMKSEIAADKRFEGANKFREQLSDQAASFMPRKEADVRMEALGEKIDSNSNRLNALQLQLSSRLDLSQGQVAGGREAIMDKRTANGAVLALVGMGITIFLAALTVIGFVIANGSP